MQLSGNCSQYPPKKCNLGDPPWNCCEYAPHFSIPPRFYFRPFEEFGKGIMPDHLRAGLEDIGIWCVPITLGYVFYKLGDIGGSFDGLRILLPRSDMSLPRNMCILTGFPHKASKAKTMTMSLLPPSVSNLASCSHFMLAFKDINSGDIHQFDFGPLGGKEPRTLQFRNPLFALIRVIWVCLLHVMDANN